MNEITIIVSVGQPFADQVRDCERKLLLHAVSETKWNVKAAARRLGMDRTNLYRYLRRLSIPIPRSASGSMDRVDAAFGDLEQRLRERETTGGVTK